MGHIVDGVIGFVASEFKPYGFQVGWVIGPAVGEHIDPEQIVIDDCEVNQQELPR